MSGNLKLQYKTAGFAIALKQGENGGAGGDGIIAGYASTFGGPDLGGDFIEKTAYDETLKIRPNVVLLWQHEQKEPIGTTLLMAPDDYGLLIKARLDPTRRGLDARILTASGSVQSLSIGYDAEVSLGGAGIKRILRKIDLFEVSLVTWPMAPGARLISSIGPAKLALLDSLQIAEVDSMLSRGMKFIDLSRAIQKAYFEAQERQNDRVLFDGKTARQVLYDVCYQIQELRKLSTV